MTDVMRALVKYGLQPGQVELREIPRPTLVPGTVLVAPSSVGVCGSDVHMWQNNQSWALKKDVVLGHESSGVIAEVGPGVEGWAVGDRVICETAAAICSACVYCHAGAYNLCPHRLGYGAMADGAFSEFIIAEPRVLHRIPDNVDFDGASMTEPYCVAYNALVERGNVTPGDVVVVQGVGAIGSVCIQIARLQGAGTIIALGTDVDSGRLQRALEFGADVIVNISREDPLTVITSMGDGYGADVVVDATGVSGAFQQSMQLVRPLGSIIKVGWGPQPAGFSLDPLVAKAATVYGSFSHTWNTWERILGLFATERLDPHSVIGGVYALDDWEEAFRAMEQGRNIKSVVRMG